MTIAQIRVHIKSVNRLDEGNLHALEQDLRGRCSRKSQNK